MMHIYMYITNAPCFHVHSNQMGVQHPTGPIVTLRFLHLSVCSSALCHYQYCHGHHRLVHRLPDVLLSGDVLEIDSTMSAGKQF